MYCYHYQQCQKLICRSEIYNPILFKVKKLQGPSQIKTYILLVRLLSNYLGWPSDCGPVKNQLTLTFMKLFSP